MVRLIVISLLAALLSACGTPAEEETIEIDNTMLAMSGLYMLHVTPNPMNPESRLAITLQAGKDIAARLLLIDHEGKVLHEFGDGVFSEGSYDYTYTPDPELQLGDYYIVLADENNLVLEGIHIRCTLDVLEVLREE